MLHSDWRAGARVSRSMFSHQRKSSSRLEVPVLIRATLSPKGAGGSHGQGVTSASADHCDRLCRNMCRFCLRRKGTVFGLGRRERKGELDPATRATCGRRWEG